MRHSGLLSVTSLVKMPSASRTRAGKPHWVIYRFTMPRRANKRWKIRRGLEPVSCLKCVHPLFHEEEENCTTTFSNNPTENPPKFQSLPTHLRADVKVGWGFEVHKAFLELCSKKVLQHNWRRWGQQKNGSIEFVTSGVIQVSGSPENEFNQMIWEDAIYTHSLQLSSCTQSEVGTHQHF